MVALLYQSFWGWFGVCLFIYFSQLACGGGYQAIYVAILSDCLISTRQPPQPAAQNGAAAGSSKFIFKRLRYILQAICDLVSEGRKAHWSALNSNACIDFSVPSALAPHFPSQSHLPHTCKYSYGSVLSHHGTAEAQCFVIAGCISAILSFPPTLSADIFFLRNKNLMRKDEEKASLLKVELGRLQKIFPVFLRDAILAQISGHEIPEAKHYLTWFFINQSREITWDMPLTGYFLETFSWEIVTVPDKCSANQKWGVDGERKGVHCKHNNYFKLPVV